MSELIITITEFRHAVLTLMNTEKIFHLLIKNLSGNWTFSVQRGMLFKWAKPGHASLCQKCIDNQRMRKSSDRCHTKTSNVMSRDLRKGILHASCKNSLRESDYVNLTTTMGVGGWGRGAVPPPPLDFHARYKYSR